MIGPEGEHHLQQPPQAQPQPEPTRSAGSSQDAVTARRVGSSNWGRAADGKWWTRSGGTTWRRELLATVLAVGVALLVGAAAMAVFDPASLARAPLAYRALIEGAVGSPAALARTSAQAAPLICAGLGIGLSFRARLFNVGAQGQALVAATMAAWIGFGWSLPPGIHLLVAMAFGVAAGAGYAALAGWLKARYGAHEVITTIMLNYVAAGLLAWLLTVPGFQRPGRGDAIAPLVSPSATMPGFGQLHLGIPIALAAAAGAWLLLTRSRFGLELRAVGFNPAAAETARIDVAATTVRVMAVSGAFAGLAGAMLALAPDVHGHPTPLTDSLVGSVGWDAVAVALLGRSSPVGIVAAGFLIGALRTGSLVMQTRAQVPFDLASVIQAVIVLVLAVWLVRR